MGFDPVAFKAMREALCFSQDDLARIFSVKQTSISAWERGRSVPRYPESLFEVLEGFEALVAQVVEEALVRSIAFGAAEVLVLRVYGDDEVFAANEPELYQKGLSASLHRIGCARAASMLRARGVRAALSSVDA